MIDGAILIGASARRRAPFFHAADPTSGRALEQPFSSANGDDVADACALAEAAFASFSTLSPDARANFLDVAADAIMAIGDDLVETAMAETGLPRPRLEGERGRTVGQLRMFAAELRRGEWLDVTIDQAQPDRLPAPRSDIRRMNVAVGPVAVFGASNFPLAFSVAGGDTASALAAGCPVVVKGHPAHPGTGELVARAVVSAVAECGLHEGVFSYLPGAENALGAALVADPRIKAAGFTGSRAGGLALGAIAAKRNQPIPVFAEMSSVNPVILMPRALAVRAEALGAAFIGSLTLGAGQFCTNPGLVIAVGGVDLDRFVAAASEALEQVQPSVMLSPAIAAHYAAGVAALETNTAARKVAAGQPAGSGRCSPALFETNAPSFLADGALGREVFGASAVVVRCADLDEVARVIGGLEGQLTATLHAETADASDAARLLPLLQDKAGRVLANGWPTGVEVCHAMVHGGPFPATSDGRTTSVGTLAITRFLRPVCFQDIPDALLPAALRATNPWRAPRTIDGRRETSH